jgi:hypothetical protein
MTWDAWLNTLIPVSNPVSNETEFSGCYWGIHIEKNKKNFYFLESVLWILYGGKMEIKGNIPVCIVLADLFMSKWRKTTL